jgi:hypothetical protein
VSWALLAAVVSPSLVDLIPWAGRGRWEVVFPFVGALGRQ